MAVPAVALPLAATPRVAASAGAISLLAVIPLSDGTSVTMTVAEVIAICFVAATATLACHHRRRAERARAGLAEAVEVMRRAVLRPVPRRLGAVRAEVRYLPAAGARIGGDVYDVVGTRNGVRLIIGDVMGKGPSAVERATDVLGAFRELAYHETTLQGMAIRLDAFLASRGECEQFVTALLAEIPEPTAEATSVELVSCGHPAPLLVAGGSAIYVDAFAPAPPLGLMGMADGWCGSSVITLEPGSSLLLYTDGVSEARDRGGAFYPLADRAALLWDPGPQRFLDQVTDDLRRHVGGQPHDDAALLLVKLDPLTAAARTCVERNSS